MTDINHSITYATLSEMLPVGMLASGGVIAQAMSTIANRQRGVQDWEAFHYERISETEFELTGGIVVVVGGIKKWPGPHDTVIIHTSEILSELNPLSSTQSPISTNLVAAEHAISDALIMGNTKAQQVQVVFSLPDDEIGRQRILKAFHLNADFFGAKVLACSLLD
jgi:hypothetical protein